jgi:hypothetical protein
MRRAAEPFKETNGRSAVKAVVKVEDGWKRVEGGTIRWRVTDAGILIDGEAVPRRTAGEPVTCRRIVEKYADPIAQALVATSHVVTRRMMVGTVAIESGGRAEAERFEPHLHDYSIGLTQTLTATARALALQLGFPQQTVNEAKEWRLPAKAMPAVVDKPEAPALLEEWRTFLRRPLNAILLCASYHRINDRHYSCGGDPVLLYAAYNSGSVMARDNPWGLAHFRMVNDKGVVVADALDAFVRFYNDACAVLPAEGDGPAAIA